MKDNSQLEPVSEVEWPCEQIPKPSKDFGWPDPYLIPTRPFSAEEQVKIEAMKLQDPAMKASQDFFSAKFDLDSKDDEDFEEDEDFMDDEEDEGEESEEFRLFSKIFKEDKELRSYYEKNYENGEFTCLVCGVIGKKMLKRFKNCFSLVNHSASISKTKQRRAHRAFGEVVCSVLGWEMNKLPNIVPSTRVSLTPSLLAQTDSQVGKKEKNDDDDQKKELEKEIIDTVGTNNGKPATCSDSKGDINANMENCKVGKKKADDNDQEKTLENEMENITTDGEKHCNVRSREGSIEQARKDLEELQIS